jgi:hypothetical protein
MARTELQWESFRQLEWALSFAQADLDSVGKDELKRLDYELGMFVRKAAGMYRGAGTDKTKQQLSIFQTGLKAHFRELAEMQPVGLHTRDSITGSLLSSTILPTGDSIKLLAIEGHPYRQIVQSRNMETQVYAALVSHIVASGIVCGQIRICPECGRLFLLKLKPQPNREFHCSTPCTNRATFRRFSEKARLQLNHSIKNLEATLKKAKRQRQIR